MTKETRELMLKIAKCEELDKAKNDNNHPCHTIVHYQDDLSAFQIPEPWNGDIENAEILFIGPNAAIDMTENERYPHKDWNDDDISEFFEKRFEEKYYKDNKTKQLYWRIARLTASWILNIPLDDRENEIEKHICLTEAVHCKTKDTGTESGFKEACEKCYKYLSSIIERFGGRYIVVFGKPAEKMLKKEDENGISVHKKYKNTKTILYCAHPNAHGVSYEMRKTEISSHINVQ